jgi:hypothetical protein
MEITSQWAEQYLKEEWEIFNQGLIQITFEAFAKAIGMPTLTEVESI